MYWPINIYGELLNVIVAVDLNHERHAINTVRSTLCNVSLSCSSRPRYFHTGFMHTLHELFKSIFIISVL